MSLLNLSDPEILPLDGGEITLYPDFLAPTYSTEIFEQLRQQIPWQQDELMIAGKKIPVPRLQAWYADPGLSYSYSGLHLKPTDWVEPLLSLKAAIEQKTGYRFNSALLNLYRDGRDSVDWHADNEKELGRNLVIASLSLGCTRTFEIKRADRTAKSRRKIQLPDGSLLVMGGAMQHNWVHRAPKEPGITEPRINITFRCLTKVVQSTMPW